MSPPPQPQKSNSESKSLKLGDLMVRDGLLTTDAIGLVTRDDVAGRARFPVPRYGPGHR